MKNKKYIPCSGLAFGDQEDMELLHLYALHGWVFREFKFMCYVLHKEKAVNLKFSYDMQKVKKQDKEDYVRIFEEAGWHVISSKDDLHFFWANKDTAKLHTDRNTQDQQYQIPFLFGIGMVIVGSILLIAALCTSISSLGYLAGVAGACIGCGLVLSMGCYARLRGKRIRADFRKKRANIILILVNVGSAVLILYTCFSMNGFVLGGFELTLILVCLYGAFMGCMGLMRSHMYMKWLAQKTRLEEELEHD